MTWASSCSWRVVRMSTWIERRYMETVVRCLPKLLEELERLNRNLERLLEQLQAEQTSS